MNKPLLAAAALLASLHLAHPASAGMAKIDPAPTDLTLLVGGINRLGLTLLAEQVAATPAANAATAPLSLGSLLGLLGQVAGGEAETQPLRALLGVQGLDHPAFIAAIDTLHRHLAQPGPLRQHLGLWHAPNLTPLPAAAAALNTALAVTPQKLEGAAAINGWIATATEGRIPALIDQLPPNAELVAASALLFRDDWAVAFDAAQTAPAPFTSVGGDTLAVPTMHRSSKWLMVWQGEGAAQAIMLPYTHPEISLILALPAQGGEVATLLQHAAAGTAPWLDPAAFTATPGRIALPRATVDSRLELTQSPALRPLFAQPLPLAGLFGPGMATQLARGMQAVRVSWDETGTEAAAATAVIGVRSLSTGPAAVDLIFNRPFAFFLRHRDTGLIIAAGQVARPAVE